MRKLVTVVLYRALKIVVEQSEVLERVEMVDESTLHFTDVAGNRYGMRFYEIEE